MKAKYSTWNESGNSGRPGDRAGRAKRWKKTVVMYATMVAVGTCAIFFLEHASLTNAFRTALVAAIGKTFAANWVSSVYE